MLKRSFAGSIQNLLISPFLLLLLAEKSHMDFVLNVT